MPILTDGKGRPFEKPEPPAPGDVGAWLDFVRATHTYNQAVADCANAAFDDEFRKALGKKQC